MNTLLVRWSAIGTLLLVPAGALLAQNPRQQRPAEYSAEELDNLVAPIALYADALIAQVLVAATFPDQIALAAKHVRAYGSKTVDEQDWDASVRAIAHYPPILGMLARDEDWAIALGQAYAAQPNEVLDSVQRLRQMAADQGNLQSTPEQKVSYQRDYIVIEPAQPEVIYVPTYEPYYVYATPLYYGYGNHFGFGIGFPWGPWLSYGCDWFTGRVVWHGGGYGAHWINNFGTLSPQSAAQPRNRYVPTNPGVYGRTVNYTRLDRDFRSVRTEVTFARHSKPASGGTTVSGTRYASADNFGKVLKPASGETGKLPTVFRGSQPSGTTFSSTVKTPDGKARSNGPIVYRGGSGTSPSTFTSATRTPGVKSSGGGTVVYRGGRSEPAQFSGATTRPAGGKAGGSNPMVYRGGVMPATFNSQPRPMTRGGTGQVYSQPVRAPNSFSGARPTNGGVGSTTIRSSGAVGGATARPSGGTINGGGIRTTGFGGRPPK